MNPYNNNPFATDTKRDTRSEATANAYLAEGKKISNDFFDTVDNMFRPMKKDSLGFWIED